MELDTGSAISTLPLQKYKEMFSDTPLVDTKAILKTYSGEKIKPEGELLVRVEHNNQVKNLTLYVVETQRPSIVWKRLATRDTTRLETDLHYFKREATTRNPKEIRETPGRVQ